MRFAIRGWNICQSKYYRELVASVAMARRHLLQAIMMQDKTFKKYMCYLYPKKNLYKIRINDKLMNIKIITVL
jgi:hypothetical protein